MNRIAAALCDRAMPNLEVEGLSQWRPELLSPLHGRVLEIGAGTGHNLEMYPAAVTELVLAEPRPPHAGRLEPRAGGQAQHRDDRRSRVELPFPNGHFDAACRPSFVLGSRPAPDGSQLRRVIRPGGRPLSVIEHVGAEQGSSQAGIERVWKRVAGNCHPTRNTGATVSEAGFDVAPLKVESMRTAPAVLRPTVRASCR
jgi:SAM-dependent methyltransferase